MPQPAFGVRGYVYEAARAFYTQRVPGGLAAVAAALEPDDRDFFEQQFFTRTLYDALRLMPISRAAAECANVPHSRLLREGAAWMADRDIRGIYRVLLGVLSPSQVALRLPSAAMRYFDFGVASATLRDPTSCEVVQHGVPAPLASFFIASTDGFVGVALRRAGAKSVSLRADSPRAEGRKESVDVVALRFEIGWSVDGKVA